MTSPSRSARVQFTRNAWSTFRQARHDFDGEGMANLFGAIHQMEPYQFGTRIHAQVPDRRFRRAPALPDMSLRGHGISTRMESPTFSGGRRRLDASPYGRRPSLLVTHPAMPPSNWSFQSVGYFNGDGRADILWRNTIGELSVWCSGESAQAVLLSGNRHPDVCKLAATADFDGDGKSDLIWQYLHGQRGVTIWPSANVSNALSLGDLPLPWEVLGAGNFDGNVNSNSDLLLRNGSSQILVVWRSAHPWESVAMGASAGNMKYFGTARDLAD